MTLLRMQDVSAFYGSAQILDSVNLKIGKGDRVAVLGRNGVGKTTLINALLGIARVGAGEIEMQGRICRNIRNFDAARLGIAVVPQGRRIIANLTVKENLMLGAASGRPGLWALETVLDLFPILRERAEISGTSLSGGQQQMLAIGRALMANPDLLILDEPSEGLAPVIVDQLTDLLNRLASAGTSILLVEQNISFVLDVVNQYSVLYKGRVIEEGSVSGVSIDKLRQHIAI
jgi:ABC-type branched-subunit amino acid transport system ATPase component